MAILLLLAGCKASTVTPSASSYSEDLSVYRKPLAPTDTGAPVTSVMHETSVLEGHIASELDSVLALIVSRNASRNGWDGFTIQVYSGLSREDAYSAREELSELGLDLKPKIEYYQPNYRVKGGSFFNRLEAFRVYQEVKRSFPQALLLPTKLSLVSNDGD